VTTTARPLDGIRELADAVLFEGYMLYPYRANDPKNRVRWQFGVLAPPGFVGTDASERAFLQTDCLLEGAAGQVTVHVRFLHVQRRLVERAVGSGFASTETLDIGDATYLPWDEALVEESVHRFDIPADVAFGDEAQVDVPGGDEIELLTDEAGSAVGRLVRERLPLQAKLSLGVEPCYGPYGVRRVRLRLENTTEWSSRGLDAPDRPDALRSALVAAHLVISVGSGRFISLIDPPE
jgi:hypothetical protein